MIIGQALPWTFGSAGITTVLAFALGTLIGIVAGWRRGGRRCHVVLPPLFVVTSALPYFWVALLLILGFLVYTNGLLPSDFNYDTSLVPGSRLGSSAACCHTPGRRRPRRC